MELIQSSWLFKAPCLLNSPYLLYNLFSLILKNWILWNLSLFRSFIPDKNMVFCPEQLLRVILAHIHYMPDHWQGNAHRYETRDQFSQLFQYKAVSILKYELSKMLCSDTILMPCLLSPKDGDNFIGLISSRFLFWRSCWARWWHPSSWFSVWEGSLLR